ncbi:MAG TPA: hypothetical protein VGR92_07040 [Steroidobacteraceae bacterium]|nr:hypothetical protein [Steroidobacteraceae bacterium]
MVAPKNSRGSGSGCFIRFLGLIILGYLLISWIPRCAQQLPQMLSNTAAGAAHGAAHAAGNAVSNWARRLLDRLESLWGTESPADRFKLVCEHLPVEGVDKVCPYLTAPLQGATESEAAQTACYLTAAATANGGSQTVQDIYKTCTRTFGDPSAFEGCVENYVKRDDTVVPTANWANCLTGSEQMFENEVHTLSEPIACIPGLPKSWCTTQSSSSGTPPTSPAAPTGANYMSCLQKYYLAPGIQARLGTPCGPQVNAGNAACVRGLLQTFNYAGQNLGQQYIAACDSQQ